MKTIENKIDLKSPSDRCRLTLEPTGLDMSATIAALMQAGQEKLDEFRTITLLSGSSLAYMICFLQGRNIRRWTESEVDTWEKEFRALSGFRPFASFVSLPSNLLRGKTVSNQRNFENFLRFTFGPAGCKVKVADLPTNLEFWTYSKRRGLTRIRPGGEFDHWTIVQLIQATCSVPWLFGKCQIEGEGFYDVSASPRVLELRKRLRLDGREYAEELLLDPNTKTFTKSRSFVGICQDSTQRIGDYGLFLMGIHNNKIVDNMHAALNFQKSGAQNAVDGAVARNQTF